jgi:hypothetical protein
MAGDQARPRSRLEVSRVTPSREYPRKHERQVSARALTSDVLVANRRTRRLLPLREH